MFEKYILVDYENVQDVQTDVINDTVKMIIIVGENQNKVPLSLIQQTQPYGNSIEWVRVSGKGRNALDFFIAYFLGTLIALEKDREYIIYSKDTGYDPLIAYLKSQNHAVKRIVSFQELEGQKYLKLDEATIQKITENLAKVSAGRRPKKKKSLAGYIKSMLGLKADSEAEEILEGMFIKKLIYEENGSIKYSLHENKKS
ncbi:PIN domain-containing protein [Brucepastera parasyntrophica]|uniref:PIN domain-containing protein n=1 Tax=Brucepastera parasyntrophica TaxID=2880008 RepID=UPI002108CD11|nr:PIN domain-containing protein [Brucepastera parasyntrophica]ULQ59443.1 PIN domain-containing protein [Brucepastera parasyntrophica]